ncbi:MAG: hypothetical protein LLG13_13620 [Bacteroidales bacterium]|nr:hypothetical protein [Bacteroidales bacterium]
MKRKSFKLIVSMIIMVAASCDEPVTVVTNYVHRDGSVTRKIEMRNKEDKFKLSTLQVPFDSTWIVKDFIEISVKGDTTWIKCAEKLFKNVDEINLTYKNDLGANKGISRKAGFQKRFKWFNTQYRFSETIDKKLDFGYPLTKFLNEEELFYFYSPENVRDAMQFSQDSLKYKALNDSVSNKVETWAIKNLVSGWIDEFSKLAQEKDGSHPLLDTLKSREDELAGLLNLNDEKFDSLWENGIILKEYLGEADYKKFKSEADTAAVNVAEQFWVNFSGYSVRISMPGKVIGSNGFIDSSKVLLWPVKSDYFLTQPYVMWAESRIPNRWAWIVSGLLSLFVISSMIIKLKKKG